MANQVYANSREVSCKAASGKSICAFPDVCFTPPPPQGVPIPYPNTGLASDTTNGSRSVKISRKEVMLKNKSYFKKSVGDEAGRAPKKGIVSSTNTGKVYFKSWSMGVKVEGENVVRHFDLTTHNHASEGPNAPPWLHIDEMAPSVRKACSDEIDSASTACAGKSPDDCGDECKAARRCLLVAKKNDKKSCCAPENTGHHLVPAHCCRGLGSYNEEAAPCVCASGWSWYPESRSGIPKGEQYHPRFHQHQDVIERRVIAALPVLQKLGGQAGLTAQRPWRYRPVRSIGIAAYKKVLGLQDCRAKCLAAQLDAYHHGAGIQDSTPLKAKNYGNTDKTAGTTSVKGWNDRLRAMGF